MDRQIKFTVGKLESLQNTVGILVLHPDQKLMPALLDMGKIIVAFVTSVRRDQRRNRRIQIVNQFDERAVFIALFESRLSRRKTTTLILTLMVPLMLAIDPGMFRIRLKDIWCFLAFLSYSLWDCLVIPI